MPASKTASNDAIERGTVAWQPSADSDARHLIQDGYTPVSEGTAILCDIVGPRSEIR
jgi:hypothetical protein